MGEPFKMVKISALVALLPFFAGGEVWAIPARCDSSKFMNQIKPRGPWPPDPDRECANNKGAKCQDVDGAKLKPGEDPAACEMVYRRIIKTIKEYEAKVNAYCTKSNAKLDACEALVGQGTKQSTCMAEHANETAAEETKLAGELMEAQGRLLVFEEAASEAKKKYLGFWDSIRPRLGAAGGFPTPGRAPHSAFDRDAIECGGKPDSPSLWNGVYPTDLRKPETSPMVAEQVKAIKYAEAFRNVAFNSAKRHQDTTIDFRKHAKKFEELARTGGSLDPNALKNKEDPNKSDITKGDQKQPAAQGGGGSPGGGQGGGSQAAAQEQGGVGATAGTPGSLNPGNTPKDFLAKGDPAKTTKNGSRTGEGSDSVGSKAESVSGSFSGSASLGRSASRAVSGERSGGSSKSSKPAAAKASGGGGGGLGGSGGDIPCLGKDCQQALGNLKSGQFAPVGSLGGGDGGLGFSGDSGTLDSLFKTDEAKNDGGGPGSMDGLASLDAGMDTAGLGGEAGAAQQGSGGEIGLNDSRDLFLRVRSFHLKALKRGMLVGVPKKL